MLHLYKINKNFGIETILTDISFVINSGERAALVGPNGSGKSTLFKIITGEIQPDSGSIRLEPGTRLGYLPQGITLDTQETVREHCWSALPLLNTARMTLAQLEGKLGNLSGNELGEALEKFGNAQNQFELLGGYAFEHKIEQVFSGLGLDDVSPEDQIYRLSGGQRTRLSLARLLLSDANILLLDEPTNHLDIQALEWLETFLQQFSGAVLVISHDRTFLDRTVNRTLALFGENHTLRSFPGNYSSYVEIAARELAAQWEQWNDQQTEIRRMEQDIHRTKHHALSVELTTTSRQPGVRSIAKKVAKKAASREKKLNRYLESDERVDKPKQGWDMKLDFLTAQRTGQVVLQIEKLHFAYPGSPILLDGISQSISYMDRVILMGKNGCGKSTLLKLILGNMKPLQGNIHVGSNVQIGYMPQEQENLPPEKNSLEIIQDIKPANETDTRNFLHYFLFKDDDVFVPATQLSYGERARLILARIVARGANFLVLDEPTNHLDIPSRENFEQALASFPGTILISTHDRALIRNIGQRIWLLEHNQVRELNPTFL